MRALLTGGAGFIATHLMKALLARGDEVVSLERQAGASVEAGLFRIKADLADSDALENVLQSIDRCDSIFHLGAKLPSTTGHDDLPDYLAVNVTATSVLLERARMWKSKKFVYMSSLGIIGKPLRMPVTEAHPVVPATYYHLSKYMGELACEYQRRMNLLSTVSLRIASPYGHGMKPGTVLAKFVELARKSDNLPVYGTGKRTQNFVHVDDVVNAAMRACDSPAEGIYNIGGPRDVSMNELADAVIRAVPGSGSRVERRDVSDAQEDYRWAVDCRKAEKDFGFVPGIDLSDGLKSMINI